MILAVLTTLLFLELAESAFATPLVEPIQQKAPPKQYKFTYDWFTSNIPVWERVLAPYAERPNVHYLEVGVFEGRSAIWMLENILTHPSSTLTAIDLFPEDLQNRYLANLRMTGQAARATTVKGVSQIELRRLPPDTYNIIYIDGGHTADMVLADAVLCWQLLRTGGLLIFDDYLWQRETYPDELRPGVAIDAFITAYRNYLDIVHRNYQAIVRKKEGPDLADPYRTILGKYVYVWQKRQLQDLLDKQPVRLSDTEKHLLETLIRLRPFGETAFVVDPGEALDADLWSLRDRLSLDFEVRLLEDRGVPIWMTAVSSLATLLLGIVGTVVVAQWRRGRGTPARSPTSKAGPL